MKKNAYSVHKFGGSSLAHAKHFIQIKSLLNGRDEVIIVSAIKETTSFLQNLLDKAKNKLNYFNDLAILEKKHGLIIEELSLDNHENICLIKKDFLVIKELLNAVKLTSTYSQEMQNYILGFGELWSARILHAYLGLENNTAFLDAANVLFVFEKESVNIDWEKSKNALDNFLKNASFDQLVITGFIASNNEGLRTNLGRNGSDFSAAIFANLFNAKSLTIWKDVNGIYSADPKQVPAAFVINYLSYKEALELAYFGAKVLHPRSIAPLVQQQIPIYVKNSMYPEREGTLISASIQKGETVIKGITSINQVALLNIEGSGLISVSGIASMVFDILHKAKINILLVAQASSAHSICLAMPAISLNKAKEVLKENLELEIARNYIQAIHSFSDCAILSIVGDEMIGSIGVAGKLCTALAKSGINIHAISQGSSERNISIVLREDDINKAMQVVHTGFYLSPKTLSIGLIGPGLVGKSLLQQLKQRVKQLSAENQVNLHLRGIINSKNMWLDNQFLDFNQWNMQEGEEANLEKFINHIADDNFPHAVLIDCTANAAIAKQYKQFLEKGIHIITPNKHANAENIAYYQQLKNLSRFSPNYFYEATVCAGLPVISTLQDLIKTGDEIIEIEGVLSGTLSFIFNEMNKGNTFSKAVFEAKKRGFTEPDPREDLGGMDVARKVICLAREIGLEVEMKDINVSNLVPKALLACSSCAFLEQLNHYDEAMNTLLLEAEAQNQRLHYVGSITAKGELKVGIKRLNKDHPFSRLEGADNMILFRTKRYAERPLVIQGPGAGAEVTAAGIFADLLRLMGTLS